MKRWLPIVAAAFLIAGCDNSADEPPAPQVDSQTSSSSPGDGSPVTQPTPQSPPAAATPAPPAADGAAAPSGGPEAGATSESAPPAASGAAQEAGGAVQPVSEEQALALMKKHNCSSCHAVEKKLIGPSYREVAQKYQGDPAAEQQLIDKVVKGGSGVWGPVPMPPHPNVPREDVQAVVDWILAGAS